MSRRERSNPEWQALIAEHQALKRKLQSKSEALLIISKDLDTAQSERDQFKLMGEKLQERCQAFKRQQADFPITGDKAKLVQLLRDARNQKLAYQQQSELLQQKLNEATGDMKLLREKFARQTIGDEGIGARHFPLHEREKLVAQLEESQQQCEHWRSEYESQVEVASEALADRDASRVKADRLNQELSYVLSGDKKRIIDIDALCMENKYLQDRITQSQAEKNSLHAQISKYKTILSSRKATKGELYTPGVLRSSGVVVSPRQLKDLLANGVHHNTAEQVADLQSIVSALLETINDKNLALHHLRTTNKILGNRVSDLERKLKTLEVAGLWNMQGSSEGININGSVNFGNDVNDGTKVVETDDRSSEETADRWNSNVSRGLGSSRDRAPACDVAVANGLGDNKDNSNDNNDEYLSSLGSRLSKLTSTTEKAADEYKLVSVTPDQSSDGSEKNQAECPTESHHFTVNGGKLSPADVKNWLDETPMNFGCKDAVETYQNDSGVRGFCSASEQYEDEQRQQEKADNWANASDLCQA